jgi:Spy/CpxP family protein refolding chaperone
MRRSMRQLIPVLAALMLASGVAAQPPGPPPGGGPGPFRGGMGDGPFGDGPGMLLPLMLRTGDLTPEQEQKVRGIMQGDRTRLHDLFEQIDKANDALATKLVNPGPVDAASLAPEIDRITALRAELLKQGLQSAIAIRAVLTPEQLARAAKKRVRMMELQKEMRQLMDDK